LYRPYLDFKTASTIATSIVHSKLDYCNSVYYNLPKSQTNRLQVIQNSLAWAVVKAPKFCHVYEVALFANFSAFTHNCQRRLVEVVVV